MSDELKNDEGAKSADTLSRDQIIAEYLESKDFIDTINAEKGKAVESFQKEKLPAMIEEKKKEWTSALEESKKLTPEQQQLQEAMKRIESLEQEKIKAEREKLKIDNKAFATSYLSEKKLPSDLVDLFISDDKDKTTQNLEAFATMMEKTLQGLKTESIKNNNTYVPGHDSTSGGGIQVPADGASRADWEAYYKAKREAERKSK